MTTGYVTQNVWRYVRSNKTCQNSEHVGTFKTVANEHQNHHNSLLNTMVSHSRLSSLSCSWDAE